MHTVFFLDTFRPNHASEFFHSTNCGADRPKDRNSFLFKINQAAFRASVTVLERRLSPELFILFFPLVLVSFSVRSFCFLLL